MLLRWVLLFVATLGGCLLEPPGLCQQTEDCRTGLICLEGICLAPRETAPDAGDEKPSPDASTTDAGDEEPADASVPDAGDEESPDASDPDGGDEEPADASVPDAGDEESPDASDPDAGDEEPPDASDPDAGDEEPPDASDPDAGEEESPDASTPDAGDEEPLPDASTPDAGDEEPLPDASTPDAGDEEPPDASTPDAGHWEFDAGESEDGGIVFDDTDAGLPDYEAITDICSPDGWCYDVAPPHPIYGVWSSDDGDLWVAAGDGVIQTIGDRGYVARWNGSRWSGVTTGATMRGVWGTSETNVWAVGDLGQLYHYDGASWTRLESGTDLDLLAIHGTGADDIWIVGGGARSRQREHRAPLGRLSAVGGAVSHRHREADRFRVCLLER